MSAVTRVALLGFGEVGQTLADNLSLLDALSLRAFDRQFEVADSVPGRAVTARDNIEAACSAADAVANCQLVISAVTASECLDAVRASAPGLAANAWFMDLNSVSPGTTAKAAQMVTERGARYVECAVMSPIQPQQSAAPMLLGGPHAADFLTVATALGFTGTVAYSDTFGRASAAKMCRSVVVKGMEALVSEALLAARHYGVEDSVLGTLGNQFPGVDWDERAHYLISRTLQHGKRRAEEMREVVATLAQADVAPLMAAACVQRQDMAAGVAPANNTLRGTLDAMRRALALQGQPESTHADH